MGRIICYSPFGPQVFGRRAKETAFREVDRRSNWCLRSVSVTHHRSTGVDFWTEKRLAHAYRHTNKKGTTVQSPSGSFVIHRLHLNWMNVFIQIYLTPAALHFFWFLNIQFKSQKRKKTIFSAVSLQCFHSLSIDINSRIINKIFSEKNKKKKTSEVNNETI